MKHEDEQAHLRCQFCSELVYIHDAKIVEKHLANNQQIKLAFCNTICANNFYLERLRESGL